MSTGAVNTSVAIKRPRGVSGPFSLANLSSPTNKKSSPSPTPPPTSPPAAVSDSAPFSPIKSSDIKSIKIPRKSSNPTTTVPVDPPTVVPPAASIVTPTPIPANKESDYAPPADYAPPPQQPPPAQYSTEQYYPTAPVYQAPQFQQQYQQPPPQQQQQQFSAVAPPPPAAALPEGRKRGVCSHWDPVKGYGFLNDHDNGKEVKRIFCHNTALAWSSGQKTAPFASLSEGDEVEFEYSQGARGIEAVKVTAVAQQSTRRKGTVVTFSDEKGYGFVMDNDPASIEGKQVMVHHKKIKGETGHKTLTVGQMVEYGLIKGPKGYAAVDVVILSPADPPAPPAPSNGIYLPLAHSSLSY
ncbi:hypothetical protein RQP46_004634 [Phenoliferia psychrophenolica]